MHYNNHQNLKKAEIFRIVEKIKINEIVFLKKKKKKKKKKKEKIIKNKKKKKKNRFIF